ncbi:MAG: stage II sporulation protein M, partial [Candidatus Zipacnadales bacterium]
MDPFVEANRSIWKRLNELLETVDRVGLRGMSAEELEEFGRLYRQVTTHLAQARLEQRDPRVVEHLNLLAGRAHAIIYRRSRRRSFQPWRFYASEFPQLFRRTFRFTATSALVFVGSAVLAYTLVVTDAGWLPHTAPEALPDAIREFVRRGVPAGAYFEETYLELGGGALSTLLWTHNLQIGVLAFAFGIGLGMGTVWALATNGMMVGSVLAVGVLEGEAARVWAI